MKYRSEIDGLRAIAVVPVILFHAGFDLFSGGFVGVDIFFVISGYLITTIILSEMESGSFSLINFYERRARRILPALFLVVSACVPFAWAWFLPVDMEDFAQSVIAVSTFTSNFLFWSETGYWEAASELKPLLHTWSLAVEEQYYIFSPLFLMLMWRFRKDWILSSFLLIALSSLLLSQWSAINWPSAAFFLLPSRIWELSVGGLIAFFFLYRKPAIRRLLSYKIANEILSLIGLLMIGFAVFTYDETTPFPGFYALLPTIGTGLIIVFSSPLVFIGRFLGTRLLVQTGLISYSAYLWHQPLFAFARHNGLSQSDELIFAVLAGLSFLLAYPTWRYVEKPFRKKGGVSGKAILMFASTTTGILIAIGLAGYLTEGFDGRKSNSSLTLQSIEKKWKVNHGLSETCEGSFTLSSDCRTADKPEILIWGDSYAMHLVQGVMASNPNAKIIQMTRSVCGPFFDIAPVMRKHPVSKARKCLTFTKKVREWLGQQTTLKYAVLSSPFSQYLSKDSSLLYRNGDLVKTSSDLVLKEFERTLFELREMGIKPVVFSPPPKNGDNIGRCLARAAWNGVSLNKCNFPQNQIIPKILDAYKFLSKLEKTQQVIRLDKLLCDNSLCNTHFGPIFIYRDTGHLSREGSAALGSRTNFYKIIADELR